MTKISTNLEMLGFYLRSGGAEGADSAFESGVKTNMEIYLPWEGFNKKFSNGITHIIPKFDDELNYVQKYHPKPGVLSTYGIKLMSRNTNQVLGLDLKTPSQFILCWTKDGNASGGTGQALRIAKDYNISIFNLKTNGFEEFKTYLQFTRGVKK